MNKIVKTELVYADIRCVFERTMHETTEGSYTDIALVAVNATDNGLTVSEQDYVPEMLMESVRRDEFLNALINGTAGVSTSL
jgi:hypothetical protein